MNLTRRLPFKSVETSPLFEADKADFPSLAPRFAALEQEVEPTFEALDRQALGAQRRHRRLRVWLMLLAFATTVLGAVQGTQGNDRWAGIAVLVVAGLATIVSKVEAEIAPGVSYLGHRARAEQLRSLYFRFLAGDDGGTGEGEWPNWLARQVDLVTHEKEHT